jgi:hypothetical protein
MGISSQVAGLYRANRPGASPGDILAALVTDRFFRLPALAVAEARIGGPAPTYVYGGGSLLGPAVPGGISWLAGSGRGWLCAAPPRMCPAPT